MPLDTHRAAVMVSKATRVWKTRQVDEKDNFIGPPCVLKDVWLGRDAMLEDEILLDIKERFESGRFHLHFPKLKTAVFEEYFLSVRACEVVPSVDHQDASGKAVPYTTKLYTNGRFLPEGPLKSFDLMPRKMDTGSAGPAKSSGIQSTPVGAAPNTVPAATEYNHRHQFKRQLVQEKKHCRLVFGEVGRDLYSAVNLREVFDALLGVTSFGMYTFFYFLLPG
jgi:hypothetical protein